MLKISYLYWLTSLPTLYFYLMEPLNKLEIKANLKESKYWSRKSACILLKIYIFLENK